MTRIFADSYDFTLVHKTFNLLPQQLIIIKRHTRRDLYTFYDGQTRVMISKDSGGNKLTELVPYSILSIITVPIYPMDGYTPSNRQSSTLRSWMVLKEKSLFREKAELQKWYHLNSSKISQNGL